MNIISNAVMAIGIAVSIIIVLVVLVWYYKPTIMCYKRCMQSHNICVHKGLSPEICDTQENECKLGCHH